MRLTTSDIAAIVSGSLVGPDVIVDGATHDSRRVRGGELFVPVTAERDGHEFIAAALAAGAVAYLTSRDPGDEVQGATAVVVTDTRVALDSLGRAARDRLPDRVVGITGSVGKTSTKDLLVAALLRAGPAAASPNSFNNELGVPLTLLGAPDDAEAVVVEMGARGRGHIARLCDIARPTIGVVTRVGAAHTEQFGTIDEVARSKSELVQVLPATGTAVLNGDDPLVAAMAEVTDARVVLFGAGPAAEVRATILNLDTDLRALICLETPSGTIEVRLAARGAHQSANAAAATAAALACGVELSDIAYGLSEASVSAWRMHLERSTTGATIINDSYNANPLSVEAALAALVLIPAGRRTAVLGVMAELGDLSRAEHRRMGELAASLGVRLIAVDAPAYGGHDVADVAEALAVLGDIGPDHAVLVKGSRAAGLEGLATTLTGR